MALWSVMLPRQLCLVARRKDFSFLHWRNMATNNVLQSSARLELSKQSQEGVAIFNSAVSAMLPQTMLSRVFQLHDDTLIVDQKKYDLDHNVHILAFGKAVGGMIRATEDILHKHIIGGVASLPNGICESLRDMGKDDLLPSANSKVKLFEGAVNNIPDECAVKAASKIQKYARSLSKDDLLITLISGGGSALLPSPIPPITLDDMAHVTRVLSEGGSTIQELNSVRIHLEQLKGGGLAETAKPAQMVCLILSDVIGDDLEVIASGPTVPNHIPVANCLNLIHSLGVESYIPQSIMSVLRQKQNISNQKETDAADFSHVQNILVGTNAMALDIAAKKASQLDYIPFLLSRSACGDASELGELLSSLTLLTEPQNIRTLEYKKTLKSCCERSGFQFEKFLELEELLQTSFGKKNGVCVLAGGETTVNVTGKGKGGRNQEMALAAAMNMHELKLTNQLADWDVCFLSGGSDGQDGPTDVAGAVVDPEVISSADTSDLNAAEYLANNNTYNFFRALNNGQHHIKTGPTGTNVMDLQILLLKPRD